MMVHMSVNKTITCDLDVHKINQPAWYAYKNLFEF